MSDDFHTTQIGDPDEFMQGFMDSFVDAFKAEMRESGDPVLQEWGRPDSEHELLPRLALKAANRAAEAANPQPKFQFRCGVCGVDLSPRNRDGRCRWGTDGCHEWKKAPMVRGCACEPRGDAPLSPCICAGERMSESDVDSVIAQMVR